jgi:hypothetical protein
MTQREIAQTEDALSVLLGRTPGDVSRSGRFIETFNARPSVPVGLPSALLERRPDIRQAEQTLVAERPTAGDSLDEQHSQWSLELVGVTGRAVRVRWSVRRRWRQSRVVGEYHYDHHQEGEALGLSDLRIPIFNGMEEVE